MLCNLFKEQRMQMPEADLMDITTFYQSVRKDHAEKRLGGYNIADEGKEDMPFLLYEAICKRFWLKGQTFNLVYLILNWNLMCRTVNTANLHFSHIRWDGDSLAVRFMKTKTDQSKCSCLFRLSCSHRTMAVIYSETFPDLPCSGREL
jgi:hypothetical protein